MMKVTMFSSILTHQSNPQQIEDLIQGLFTPKEIAEIERRLQIISMLKAQIPQHEIAKRMKVGVATVTRGSRELQKGRFSQIKPNKNAWRSNIA